MTLYQWLSALWVCFLISGSNQQQLEKSRSVWVEQGLVRGKIYNIDGKHLQIFRGIPYAEPPIGDLRLKVDLNDGDHFLQMNYNIEAREESSMASGTLCSWIRSALHSVHGLPQEWPIRLCQYETGEWRLPISERFQSLCKNSKDWKTQRRHFRTTKMNRNFIRYWYGFTVDRF